MADFYLWQKATLVKFAEEATERMEAQEIEIRELKAACLAMHLQWKNALRELAAKDTVGQPWNGKHAADCRAQAALAGETKFLTGAPCKHGHLAARYTSNGVCVACQRAWDQKEKGL